MIASSSLMRSTASSVALKRKLVSYDLTDSSDSDEEAENNISTVFVLSASPALAAAAVPAVKTSASNKVDETALTTVLTFGKTADCPKTEDHSDEQLHQTSPALADKAPNLEAPSLKEGGVGKEEKEGEKPKKKSKRGPASPPPETAAASTAQGGGTSSSVNLSCSSDWPMSEPMPDGNGSSGNSAGNREGNGKGNGKGSGKGKDTAKDKDEDKDDELDFKSSNWLKMAASLPPTYSVSQVGVSFFRSFFLSFFLSLCLCPLFCCCSSSPLLSLLLLLLPLLLPLIALLFLFPSLPFPSIYQRLLSVLCFVPFSSQSVSQSVSQLLINRSYTSPIFPLSLSPVFCHISAHTLIEQSSSAARRGNICCFFSTCISNR